MHRTPLGTPTKGHVMQVMRSVVERPRGSDPCFSPPLGMWFNQQAFDLSTATSSLDSPTLSAKRVMILPILCIQRTIYASNRPICQSGRNATSRKKGNDVFHDLCLYVVEQVVGGLHLSTFTDSTSSLLCFLKSHRIPCIVPSTELITCVLFFGCECQRKHIDFDIPLRHLVCHTPYTFPLYSQTIHHVVQDFNNHHRTG